MDYSLHSYPRELARHCAVRSFRIGSLYIFAAPVLWLLYEAKIVLPHCSTPKYWIKDSKARRRFRELLFAVVRTLSEVGAELGLATVGWEQYQQIKDDRLAELDESIFECAHLLADLMAVDGALVLTAARDIIGFGARFRDAPSRGSCRATARRVLRPSNDVRLHLPACSEGILDRSGASPHQLFA